MIKTRTDVINAIAKKIGAQSYLEIGVFNPARNMNQVLVRRKVGVDPARIPPPDGDGHIYRLTSDQFFAQTHEKYDIIFVDGDHTHKQSFKDIINAIYRLNPGGFLVVHDVNPATSDEAAELKPSPGARWCGQVYMSWVGACAKNPHACTVDIETGVGVITREGFGGLHYDKTSYVSLEKNRTNLLNLVTAAEWQTKFAL